MGKLIKNHWARLIVMTAAACKHARRTVHIAFTDDAPPDQVAAALEGFFWPKFFFDWLTKNFDAAVKPIPILQIINLVVAIFTLALEWPAKPIAGTWIHRSMEGRLVWLPFAATAAILLHQATNPALYYVIATGVYFWAYTEGEVSITCQSCFLWRC